MAKKIPTVWMWQDGMSTRGAGLDLRKNIIEWQLELAEFCSVDSNTQSMADFLEKGIPNYITAPDDVLAEITESVKYYLGNENV